MTLFTELKLKTIILILELQNRKILEELQLKKQILLKQGVVQSLGSSISTSSTSVTSALVSHLNC